MKRMLVLSTLAALLLTACAAERTEGRAQALQRRYLESESYTAEVVVTIPDEADMRTYTLRVERAAGETRLRVLEPEELAGIGAVLRDGGALSLEFDGTLLDAGSAGPGVSALNSPSILLRAAAEGYVTERSEERFAGEDALRLCFETEYGGERLLAAAYFDGEDRPLYAELERDGEILAYLEFTDFDFRDILPSEQKPD